MLLRVILFVAGLASAVPAEAHAQERIRQADWSSMEALDWPAHRSGTLSSESMWSLYQAGGTELYCRTTFSAEDVEARRIAENRLSIEHVYPASLIAQHFGFQGRTCERERPGVVSNRSTCEAALSDLHNEWPAYERLNQSRSTAKFGILRGEGTTDPRWRPFCRDFERQRAPRRPVVEPTLAASGDIARTLLYMHFVYGLPLEDVVTDPNLLLRWHRDDPPDNEERRRERLIRRIQPGMANPLVLVSS